MSGNNHLAACRLATKEDRPEFVRMWASYLEENRSDGSLIHADEHNLKVYRDYFDAYATGMLRGICLFFEPYEGEAPAGALLIGEEFQPSAMHDDLEVYATLLGVWVDPKCRVQGVSVALTEAALPLLREHGFPGIRTDIRGDNNGALGLEAVMVRLGHTIRQIHKLILVDMREE